MNTSLTYPDLLEFIKIAFYSLIRKFTAYGPEVAPVRFNRQAPLLPPIQAEAPPDAQQLRACFQAYLDVQPLSTVAARYFYKRYRRLLLQLFVDHGPLVSRAALAFLED